MARARLFYVIGASGSGKDSLLRHAREHLSGHLGIVFAHRYITRPHDAGGENHIALSDAEFDARLAGGLFAMHWSSHGLRYGIGKEINLWLAKGCSVVLNGSREYLEKAMLNYHELTPVLVEVPPDILKQRLQARGRETPGEIEQRLTHAPVFHGINRSITCIRNDADIATAGGKLVELLLAGQEQDSCA